MKKIYLLIVLFVIVSSYFEAVAQQLKSISQTYPVVDTTLIVKSTVDVEIAKDGIGTWTTKELHSPAPFVIHKGDAAPYDADYKNYAAELIGGRYEKDPHYCNSFMLWAPADSGVPWNYTNSKVKFDIKIADSENYAFKNNWPERDLALYFWVAVKHAWDSEPKAKYVRLYLDSPKGPLQTNTEGGGNTAWSSIFSTGLGKGLNDGAWHTIEVDLIDIIEKKKQACIDEGVDDVALGKDASEGVNWHWYGVLGLEFFTIHALVGNVTIVGDTTNTAVKDYSFENSVRVYPNPSSGDVKIDLGNISNTVSVDVYNLTGQLLKTVNNVSSNTPIRLSTLAQGCYYLKVHDEKRSVTKKVIVRR